MKRQTEGNSTFVINLILSIIQLVFVPCFYGLIPLIFTILANSSFKSGDFDTYEKRTKLANRFLMIGWIIFGVECVVVIGGFIYLFYAMVTSGF